MEHNSLLISLDFFNLTIRKDWNRKEHFTFKYLSKKLSIYVQNHLHQCMLVHVLIVDIKCQIFCINHLYKSIF